MLNDFFRLLFPSLCVCCGNSLVRSETIICISCLYKLPKTDYHLHKNNTLNKVFWGRNMIQNSTAYYFFTSGGRVQKLLLQLKYNGNEKIGNMIGKRMAAELQPSGFFDHIDMIVPMPIHPKKKKKRGYNQSTSFARGLSNILAIDVYEGGIVRTIHTETQTNRTRLDRWKNVYNAFELHDPNAFENKHILLVDDVITTGATVEACAMKILQAKGAKVSVASIAYTA